MFSILALGVALTAHVGINPSASQGYQVQNPPWRDLESFRLQQLEWARERRTGLEGMNEFYQKSILTFMNHRFLTPERVAPITSDLSMMLERGLVKVEFMKRYERELELWGEQRTENPGTKTDRVALERIRNLLQEEKNWNEAWDARHIAPLPRQVKP